MSSIALTARSVLLTAFLLAAFAVAAATDQHIPATDQTDTVVPEVTEPAEPSPTARLQQQERGATLAEEHWGGRVEPRRRAAVAARARISSPAQVAERASKSYAAYRRRAPRDPHMRHIYKQGRWVPVRR